MGNDNLTLTKCILVWLNMVCKIVTVMCYKPLHQILLIWLYHGGWGGKGM
jgi:hypothetical protein